MFKHIITYSFEHTLSDINHHSCINKRCSHTGQEDTSQNCQCFIKAGEIRLFLSDQRKDKIIQQITKGERYRGRRYCTDQNTEEYQNKLKFIFFRHIFQKTFCCLYVILRHSCFLFLIHPLRLLSPVIHILLCRFHLFSEVPQRFPHRQSYRHRAQ